MGWGLKPGLSLNLESCVTLNMFLNSLDLDFFFMFKVMIVLRLK